MISLNIPESVLTVLFRVVAQGLEAWICDTHTVNQIMPHAGGPNMPETMADGSSSGDKYPNTTSDDRAESIQDSIYLDAKKEVVNEVGAEVVRESEDEPIAIDELQPNQNRWSVNYIREKCGAFVNDEWSQLVIVVLIVINSIMMGIGTFDFVTDNPDVERVFEAVDRVFLIIFTIELALQFIYRGFSLFTDGWLVFDFVIIVLSWSLESLQIVRAFRIFRALRLITRIDALKKLIMALFAVIPRMTAITALLLLVFYIFSVLFTQLFKDLELSQDYFTRLDATLFTLFEMMTMEWIGVARECMAQRKWAWFPFVVFVMVSGFIVFNLIIAVVCDAVAVIEREAHQEEKDDSTCDDSVLSNAQGRINDISEQFSSIAQQQREMQQSLEAIARDLYFLQGSSSSTWPLDRKLHKPSASFDSRSYNTTK